ncbi:DUF4349 domain-containing protein [Halobacillus sp. H74]|uniref:DUF4349 domain-containing protein n=1 Tax=Halobacillus sp. H74 TaxID=3457436 RepID=UPI003FCE58F7
MRKKSTWLGVLILIFFLAACSNEDSQESTESNEDASTTQESKTNGLSETPEAENDAAEETQDNQTEKMMIYEAHIELETDDYDQFYQSLEKRMNEYDAYMVETNIHKTERGNREGHLRLRVPQPNFDALLGGFEDITDNIKSRNINSRDVTKDFVDLESRLKAKEEIEARLLSFLDEAEATEDLIKISQDLERVQSEIETIKGEMNYLSNQSDFSTITLSIKETKVVVPEVDQQDLNTWGKTKQAFFTSINGINSFFSWLAIFFIGYSPVLLPILLIAALFWWRRKKKAGSES